LVATPVHLREADLLSHKILGNENILQHVSDGKLSGLGRFTNIFGKAASGLTDLTGEVYMGMTSTHREYYNAQHRDTQTKQMRVTNHDRPARVLSA
ncbi:hypothetical protein M2T36_26770, partial [Escherichia coli]|uniref:hypothetical protein n=1 Tax=Escherichia coli TaxID=562 RepID=UPI00200F32D7